MLTLDMLCEGQTQQQKVIKYKIYKPLSHFSAFRRYILR